MAESAVKVHGKCYLPPAAPPSGQAVFRPFVERGPVRAPAAMYLPQRKHESQATSVPIEVENVNNPRSGSHDPEKEPFGQHSHSSHSLPYNHSRLTYADYEDEGDDSTLNQHAIWILVGSPVCPVRSLLTDVYGVKQIYLSALSPLLALAVGLYTLLLMGTLLLLFFPLCFCSKQLSIGARFRRCLSPLVVFQLGLIYSSSKIGDPVHSETSGFIMLVLVSMLSPLYAMAIAVATWVAGVFWFYTAVLGNPDGKEVRNDGREAVLAVRGYWEKWLIKGLEPEDRCTLRDNRSEGVC